MDIDDLIGALRTQRDDLRVRLHLLKAELRDEFNDLEGKWEHLESRAGHLKDASQESAEDVGAAAGAGARATLSSARVVVRLAAGRTVVVGGGVARELVGVGTLAAICT